MWDKQAVEYALTLSPLFSIRPGYRHLWPTATNGLLLHEIDFGFIDTQYTGYPTWELNSIGNAFLRDTLPSSIGLADADVTPLDPYVYSTGPASRKLLVENLGVLALPPAATPADNAISVRLAWLDAATGQRGDGLGCSATSGLCVPPVSAAPSLTCGATLTAALNEVSTVGVWTLTAPQNAPSGQLIELSSCASSTSSTNVGVFSDIPVGAAYYGSTVARGARAFSNFTVGGGGGTSVSPCGTLRLPFGPGATYYVVVGLDAPPTGGVTASVSISATCATSMPCGTPSSLLLLSGLTDSYTMFNGYYAVDMVTPLLNGALTWVNVGLGASDQWTRLHYSPGQQQWVLGYSTWPDGGWNDVTATAINYILSGVTTNPDVTASTGWHDSFSTPYPGVSITCACAAGLLQSTPGAACSSCPGGNMYAAAGATAASGQCGCGGGSAFNAATGGCSVCPANTFRNGYSFSTDACLACPAGMTSLPGSTSVLACVPVSACDQITVSGTYAEFNGVFVKGAGTSAGWPYWYQSAHDMYLAFSNNLYNSYDVNVPGGWVSS